MLVTLILFLFQAVEKGGKKEWIRKT